LTSAFIHDENRKQNFITKFWYADLFV